MALVLAMAGCSQPVGQGPIIVVTASYPGASAQVVADTVGVPIEQQINGVEGMERLESESRNDGSYIACVRFRPNTDPIVAAVLVQNRVALAKPMLPEQAKGAGVTVQAKAARQSRNCITITLLDRGGQGWDALRRFSAAVFSRLYAEGAITQLDVFPGFDENQVLIDIDREKCGALGVQVAEVSQAMKGLDAGNSDAWQTLSVRAASGESVPLGSVAAIKLASGPAGVYRVDMYPAIRIIASLPGEKTLKSAASRCAELAEAERQTQDSPAGFAVLIDD